jgi:hypothetical protein
MREKVVFSGKARVRNPKALFHTVLPHLETTVCHGAKFNS